jgi:hypothetical protein
MTMGGGLGETLSGLDRYERPGACEINSAGPRKLDATPLFPEDLVHDNICFEY